MKDTLRKWTSLAVVSLPIFICWFYYFRTGYLLKWYELLIFTILYSAVSFSNTYLLATDYKNNLKYTIEGDKQ